MGEVCKQPQPVCESVQDLVRIPKNSLGKTHPGQVRLGSREMTERQKWIQDKFNLLKTHIRRKRQQILNLQVPGPKSQCNHSLSTTHLQRVSPNTESMEMRMQSDTTQQPSIANPSVFSKVSTVDQQVMEQ